MYYIGEVHRNKYHGSGNLYYVNGDSYVGLFQDHLKVGKGKYTWANGDEYQGPFTKGLIYLILYILI